jgi:hypothetical protein
VAIPGTQLIHYGNLRTAAMVALLYINIKVEQRILNTRNISKSIVDNVCFVGIAVLKMINLFVRFSLIAVC